MKFGIVERVREIFEAKGWELTKIAEEHKFNLFCEMLERHNEEDEINLLIELLEDFLHLNNPLYCDKIAEALIEFFDTIPTIKNIFILPLVSKSGIGKTKSGNTIHYLFRGNTLKLSVPKWNNFNISVVDNPKLLKKELNHHEIVILVDDFIGTGESAVESLEYLLEFNPDLDKSKIYIYSIVIQKSGLNKLIENGVNVFYSILIGKGISDNINYDDFDKSQKLEIMNGIEKKLSKLKPEFKFGFKQSEALVSMERTPNNTFPIFWYEYQKKYKPPFPR